MHHPTPALGEGVTPIGVAGGGCFVCFQRPPVTQDA